MEISRRPQKTRAGNSIATAILNTTFYFFILKATPLWVPANSFGFVLA